MAPATRASWQIRPLPATRAPLRYERSFTPDEHARVVLGLVPRLVDDKWFIYFEQDWLYLHRASTGVCIYGVRLGPAPEKGASVVEEAWVNRTREEYTRTDDEYDARLLSFLVDRLLLGRDVPFPVPDVIAETNRTESYRQHVVGPDRRVDKDLS
jgi:hypothetical protein